MITPLKNEYKWYLGLNALTIRALCSLRIQIRVIAAGIEQSKDERKQRSATDNHDGLSRHIAKIRSFMLVLLLVSILLPCIFDFSI